MPFRIGVDTGGTFVDVIVSDEHGGLRLSKSPSDPRDLAGSVLAGLEQAATDHGVSLPALLSQTERIIHGSTVATNALLTRRGATAALLTTQGFRDVLGMRRGMRERQMDSHHAPPPPLVPRELVYGIRERLDCEGQVVVPLDRESLDEAVAALSAADVKSVAVCFMYSFLDSSHEVAVGQALEERLPGVDVSLSSEVLPQLGLYARVSSTAVNAVVSPLLSRYLAALGARLEEQGFRGNLLLMQSNGGVSSLEVGKRFGVRAVLSGPAAAPVAAAHFAGLFGLGNAISVDMGGTSFDVCLINEGVPHVTTEGELAGYRIGLPMVAIHTIGAGGGSIIGVNARRLLTVGPQSAGAYPGPVCYGRGGTAPTVTDANLLLGYLDPHAFWSGRLTLDVAATEAAMREHIGEPLGLDVFQAAEGAYRVVNENMVDAIREVSIRRGHDPRSFVLVAAGGAGPLHVGALALELDIPLVIVPRLASVFCALGGLLSDLRHEFTTSLVSPLESLDLERVNAVLGRLQAQGLSTLRSEAVAEQDIAIAAYAELRYVGQFNEVAVPLASARFTPRGLDAVIAEFHRRHEAVNGWQDPSHGLELVNLGIVAIGKTEKPAIPTFSTNDAGRASGGPRERRIYWRGQPQTVPVYDGLALAPRSLVSGPAVVEHETTTLIVPTECELLTDDRGNGLMYRKGADLESVLERLRREA